MWPFVNEWLARFDSMADGDSGNGYSGNKGESSYTSSCSPCGHVTKAEMEIEADRHDLAAQGFLHLLQQFCIILLQDLVIMKQEFPVHPLWTDLIFKQDDYQVFAKDVKLSLLEIEESEEV